MQHSFIYGLYDSAEPGVIRYVGKTYCIKDRIRDHLSATTRGERTHKARWIRLVLRAGRSVRHVVLGFATSNDEANDLERHFIKLMRSIGMDLTNATDGGDGQSPGYRPSAEARAKVGAAHRGRKRSPESVRKTAEAHRGRKRSPETCARISAAKMGKPGHAISPATRAKLAVSNRKPKPYMAAINSAREYTPELRARMRAAQLRRYEHDRLLSAETPQGVM